MYHAETELNALRDSDSDSDSYQDDSSDEEHEKVIKEKDLEWDDSTLSFWNAPWLLNRWVMKCGYNLFRSVCHIFFHMCLYKII